MSGVGVVIGRFQVHELHEGHVQLLEFVRRTHPDGMLILLGVKPSPATVDNPLDLRARMGMLQLHCPGAIILPLLDARDDVAWSRNVDRQVEMCFPGRSAVLYGGRDSFIPHYHGHYATRVLDFGAGIAGSDVRERLGAVPKPSSDFRAGVIYALANLPPRIYLTVDIAVRRVCPDCGGSGKVWDSGDKTECDRCLAFPGGEELLLVRKPDESLWRFPGGFVSLEDPTLEHAARRELFEETGLTIEGALTFAGSFTVDDWRSRGAADVKHLTTLWDAPFSFGAARAADDVSEVSWFPINTVRSRVIAEHQPLLASLAPRSPRSLVSCEKESIRAEVLT